jgi:hypothetical protein
MNAAPTRLRRMGVKPFELESLHLRWANKNLLLNAHGAAAGICCTYALAKNPGCRHSPCPYCTCSARFRVGALHWVCFALQEDSQEWCCGISARMVSVCVCDVS